MSDDKSTRDTLSTGDYRAATVVPAETPSSATTSLEGRVVSTRRTTGHLTVRVTTRPVPIRSSTR